MFLLQLLHNKPIEIYLDSACNNTMNSNIRFTLINSRIIKTFFDDEYIFFSESGIHLSARPPITIITSLSHTYLRL
jgi:hypothetical protein